MLSPYKGAAAATFKKATDHRKSWTSGKIYKNSYGRYYYINQRGYFHAYGLTKTKFNDQVYFCITDFMLTRDNTLEAKSHSKDFKTETEAQQFFRKAYLDITP